MHAVFVVRPAAGAGGRAGTAQLLLVVVGCCGRGEGAVIIHRRAMQSSSSLAVVRAAAGAERQHNEQLPLPHPRVACQQLLLADLRRGCNLLCEVLHLLLHPLPGLHAEEVQHAERLLHALLRLCHRLLCAEERNNQTLAGQ